MKCMALPRHKLFIYHLEYAFLGANHMCTKLDILLNIYNSQAGSNRLKEK